MAGDHNPLIKNAAIERWGMMRGNLHQTFRWTRTTMISGFICSVAIPLGIYAFCYAEDYKWDITAIRRNQTKEDMKIKH
ncbi:NADH-ubiquinone oxidoreductase subunit [Rhizophagus clarus]|uniref:NADH-ubiquinone oxidoreductase subunit n=1 Tax=Rhizophagus clarus TaxID=94130 RepID=A0A8H3LSY3_9GLOM|nr:NADH-ubiquinone oxidoreductase subunit [Rhizophagus clarus]